MSKKNKTIPVNRMTEDVHTGIAIERFNFNDLSIEEKAEFKEENQAHRHDRHSFFLLEEGTVAIEIDFQKYTIEPFSVIYIHPNQVHHTITTENVIVSCWAIDNENLNPEYLKLLEEITPVKPLVLEKEIFSVIAEAVLLGIQLSALKSDKLYHSIIKDSCNSLVALVISQYLKNVPSTDKISRFDVVTKTFRELLEKNYTTLKRPADYSPKLNISTPYLNECIKNATGFSVSHHIQERVILEAKRLLYHSDKSVKEIASVLGYDDYAYFSRLFTKVTGMSALTFRNKNLD
ncbi:helix-turn-helix transcriptional regulator [Flavobacterium sp. AC]|uniref:Helix-turn-helix transcriptional regulator n=1 Tax=Flavobacterium azizsancarii TaxID=2961580 RepID=A0ABT4WBG0_9FLAO|nr:helix-turn-helix transcriptional regulator [Flavobacterium azizsancarii]MDA6069919.1 helix-turn-helix transcriptional regulator [Flavobacterium azizsancarii]